MQYKLTLVVKTLADASQEDCAPWGDKFEQDLVDGTLRTKVQCRNDAQWKIQTHNETVLRKVCCHHINEGMQSAYEEICGQFPIAVFPGRGQQQVVQMPRRETATTSSTGEVPA